MPKQAVRKNETWDREKDAIKGADKGRTPIYIT
jgi:hypothetical protein